MLEAATLDALARLLTRALPEALGIESAFLLLWNRKLDSFETLTPGETSLAALRPESPAAVPEAGFLLAEGALIPTPAGGGEGVLVPLMARSGVVGMLVLGARAQRRQVPFRPTEVRLLSVLASRAALALENHLYQKELISSERMAALGALGPNMVLIHMGWASPREVVLARDFDLKISCTPSTGFRLGFGSMQFGRFPEMLELGVTVALGSDAAMSSNFLDIVRQMYLVSGGAKAARLDPTIMRPEQALEMATRHGAKAALWEREIGSLEAGKRADIATFDTRKPEWRPVLNPIANLVYASRGGADTVIVDGKILMADGVVKTIDERALLEESQVRAEAIASRSGLADLIKPKWPVS